MKTTMNKIQMNYCKAKALVETLKAANSKEQSDACAPHGVSFEDFRDWDSYTDEQKEIASKICAEIAARNVPGIKQAEELLADAEAQLFEWARNQTVKLCKRFGRRAEDLMPVFDLKRLNQGAVGFKQKAIDLVMGLRA